jgi:hypothetical protein
MRHIFEKDFDMREGVRADEPLFCVGLPSQSLNILIRAHAHKALAHRVAAIPKALQQTENEKHAAMIFHE